MNRRVTTCVLQLFIIVACGGTHASGNQGAASGSGGGTRSATGEPLGNGVALTADVARDTTAETSCAGGGQQPTNGDYSEALKQFGGGQLPYEAVPTLVKLAERFPASPALRLTLGQLEYAQTRLNLSKTTRKPAGPVDEHARRAVEYEKQALALQARGCTMIENDTLMATHVLAMSYLAAGDYASSQTTWRALLQKWPSLAFERLIHAAQLCDNDDESGCATELQQAFDVTCTQAAPSWTGLNPTVAEMAKTTGEAGMFESIKKSGRLATIVQQAQGKSCRADPSQCETACHTNLAIWGYQERTFEGCKAKCEGFCPTGLGHYPDGRCMDAQGEYKRYNCSNACLLDLGFCLKRCSS